MDINKSIYKVLGLMSGTSLDGVDLCYCKFLLKGDSWSYEILETACIPYDQSWKKKLDYTDEGDMLVYMKLDNEYGHYLGNLVKNFINSNNLEVDFVASHGHTVLHQPEQGYTFQIGSGPAISAECGRAVICDFREKDVALGGQGAPLVPVGDELLFSKYDYCLNLGGIANISFTEDNQRIAFDICPCNILLNSFAAEMGKEFDENGEEASKGIVNKEFLDQLNNINYYKSEPPKSLGKEDINKHFIPVINNAPLSNQDKLRTYCEHIAIQINNELKESNKKMIITGGGALNSFLIERITSICKEIKIVIPDKELINFKEAMVFAFLGVLRMRNEINCYQSVTGAMEDSVVGVVYK